MNTTGNFIYPYFLLVSFSTEGKFLSISTFFGRTDHSLWNFLCFWHTLWAERLCQNRNLSNLLYYIISAYWRLCHALCRWLVDTIFSTKCWFSKRATWATRDCFYWLFYFPQCVLYQAFYKAEKDLREYKEPEKI